MSNVEHLFTTTRLKADIVEDLI